MDSLFALVVDDSKSARFAMRRFLESCGHIVDTADGGADALDRLPQRRPDLLFLDHLMPGMDGLEVLDHLRRDRAYADLPVVLCSSNDSEEFAELAQRRGASAVMVKPPTAAQLAAVLQQLRNPARPTMPTTPVEPARVSPPPARVQTIRDPEIAIEHAVMKTLRDALPGVAAPLSPAAQPLVSAAPAAAPPAAGNDLMFDQQLDRFRDQTDAWLRQLFGEVTSQLGELRKQVGAFNDAVTHVHRERAADASSLHEAGMALDARIDSLSQRIDANLEALRREIDLQRQTQDQRIEQIALDARAAAMEEAHAVSERVVMNAAKRISDQISESLLKVLQNPVSALGR